MLGGPKVWIETTSQYRSRYIDREKRQDALSFCQWIGEWGRENG
jgi:hypothetical protein